MRRNREPRPLPKGKFTHIEEKSDFGVYVWQCADGKAFSDGEGHWMYVRSARYDIAQINKLRDAARAHGVEEGGKAVFVANAFPISDDERAEQEGRLAAGLIPSQLDYGAWADEEAGRRVG